MYVKIGTALLVLIAIVLFVQSDWLSQLQMNDALETADVLENSLPFLLLLSFVLITVQSIVTAIPLALILLFNYLFLGFWIGYVWSLSTTVVASITAFYLYRYWLQPMFRRRVKEDWVQAIERNGFWLVLSSRLIPIMPSSLINLAAGSSQIRFIPFTSATTIGNALYVFLLFLLMEGLVADGSEWIVVVVVVFLGIGMLLKRRINI